MRKKGHHRSNPARSLISDGLASSCRKGVKEHTRRHTMTTDYKEVKMTSLGGGDTPTHVRAPAVSATSRHTHTHMFAQ